MSTPTTIFSVGSLQQSITQTLTAIEPGKRGAFLTTIKLEPATGTYSVQGVVAAKLNDVWTVTGVFDLPLDHHTDPSGMIGVKASW